MVESKDEYWKKIIFGIDYGTTNSVIAAYNVENKTTAIVNTMAGKRNFVSTVAINADLDNKVDRQAENTQKSSKAAKEWKIVRQAKTMLGQESSKFASAEERAAVAKKYPGWDIDWSGEMPALKGTWENGKTQTLKFDYIKTAEAYNFRSTIEHQYPETKGKKLLTVCCFPARFTHNQREATKACLSIAGLEPARMTTEPTAAALNYMMDAKKENANFPADMKVLVVDLGGGTLDFTIAELDSDNCMAVVQSTEGDTNLGGHDFDELVAQDLLKIFCNLHNFDYKTLKSDSEVMKKLLPIAEDAKIQLNSGSSTTVDVEVSNLYNGEDMNIDYTDILFQKACQTLIDRFLHILDNELFAKQKMKFTEIDKVLLVGGSSRLKAVSREMEKRFGASKLVTGLNRDEAVALGALEMTKILAGADATADWGAPLLLDSIPFSICIETAGNVATKLSERDTTVPITKEMEFSNYSDYQEHADIRICEGENAQFSDNEHLLDFRVKLRPAKRGESKIKVTIHIDESMLTKITAKDTVLNEEAVGTVTLKTSLSEEEKKKYAASFEANKEKNEKIKRLQTKRNEMNTKIDHILKTVEAAQDNIKTQFKDKIDDLKELSRRLIGTDFGNVPENHLDADEEKINKLVQELEASSSGAPRAAASEEPVVEEAE